MDVPVVVSTAGSVVALLKTVAEAVRASGKADVMAQVIELQAAILEMQQGQFALNEENRVLRTKVGELEDRLRFADTIQLHFAAYWVPRKDGTLDGPMSPHHWDNERKPVRMSFNGFTESNNPGAEAMHFICGTTKGTCTIPVSFIREKGVWEEKDIDQARHEGQRRAQAYDAALARASRPRRYF